MFWFKTPKPKPVMKMVVPGRRALGEDWQEVTIAVDEKQDRPVVTENRPTQAPPSGTPIFVPGAGALAMEHVDFLLEGARKTQEYRGKHPRDMSLEEFDKWVNNRFQDWMQQKLAAWHGKTQIGPAGLFQREKP